MIDLLIVSAIRFYREALASVLAQDERMGAISTASEATDTLAKTLASFPPMSFSSICPLTQGCMS